MSGSIVPLDSQSSDCDTLMSRVKFAGRTAGSVGTAATVEGAAAHLLLADVDVVAQNRRCVNDTVPCRAAAVTAVLSTTLFFFFFRLVGWVIVAADGGRAGGAVVIIDVVVVGSHSEFS